MQNNHPFYLELCLSSAWERQLETLPNPAVGALVLDKNGAILSRESHRECGKPHAEVLALQKAYALLSKDTSILSLQDSQEIHNYLLENAQNLFLETTIYVTLEPCGSAKKGHTPSCATLLKALKPKCVIIGAQDIDKDARGGAEELKESGILVIKAWEMESLRTINAKCNTLLTPFYRLQTKKHFLLFKYASRLDGSFDGGQISSKVAQSKMHNYRAKANFLLISGESVRKDLPTLDARFATLEKKAPDVLILTHDNHFPKTAPLFNIKNRQVTLLHNPNEIQDKQGFIFCEGGAGLFNTLKDSIDMLLILLNPSFKQDASLRMSLTKNFTLLHSEQIGEDLFLWLIPKS